jgi:hypothetical protein
MFTHQAMPYIQINLHDGMRIYSHAASIKNRQTGEVILAALLGFYHNDAEANANALRILEEQYPNCDFELATTSWNGGVRPTGK